MYFSKYKIEEITLPVFFSRFTDAAPNEPSLRLLLLYFPNIMFILPQCTRHTEARLRRKSCQRVRNSGHFFCKLRIKHFDMTVRRAEVKGI